MKNAAVAAMFETMADIMEIQREDPFRVNSYRKVARVLGDLTEDVEKLCAEGRLTEVPGIGQSSAEKVRQFLETGTIEAYERLTESFPQEALEMLRIPGLGPKTVGRLMREKDVKSIDELEQAIQEGRLDGMQGIGAKKIENIVAGIEFLRSSAGRILLGEALPVAQGVIERLRGRCKLKEAEAAGSLRRMRETIGDIDVLATVSPGRRKKGDKDEVPGGRAVVEAFASLDGVAEVLASGETRGSVRTDEGLQVDLRVVRPESYGAALVYFTGSKAHNIRIRGIAIDKGLKINEYGVFRGKKRIAGKTEAEVYDCLGLPWIPPELREDRGEVEAAAESRLPNLLALDDIRGDLHAHSDYSDGNLPVQEMAKAARDRGYEYVAITDHSASLGVAHGLDLKRLRKQQAEIDDVREKLGGGFRLLKGTEVDILPDGTLDYPEEVLAGLDIVVASVHTNFKMAEKQMTARIIRAVEDPHVTCIGHLTGRLLGQREAYEVDVEAVVKACAEHRTALELNAHMDRLDISDQVCRMARQAGVKVAIGTDAHNSMHYWMMELGVATARRGWLGRGDVLNCMGADELLDYLHAGRG